MSIKKQNFIYKFFLIIIIILFLFLIRFHAIFLNFLGEYTFLELHQNKLAIALLAINDATTVNKNYETYYLLGRIQFVENNLKESIINYNKSVNINPDFKENYYGLGLSYGFTSILFYDKAIYNFQKYIDLDNREFKKTGHHAYGAWAGYNDLAWIYFMQGDFENSEKTARKGLEISGTNPWLLNILGATLLEQKKCTEGSQYLENAKNILNSTNSGKFGEAYSGDSPDFWEQGKEQMQKTIDDNLLLCKSLK